MTTIFYLGSGTILVTIFRWHFLIILGTYFFLSVLPQIFPRLWSSGLHGLHKEEIKVLNIYILAMLTVCLTLAGVLVNYFPGEVMGAGKLTFCYHFIQKILLIYLAIFHLK